MPVMSLVSHRWLGSRWYWVLLLMATWMWHCCKGTLKNGKFVVKVKGLSVGSHSLTVSYKGDGFTDKGVSKTITVTVTK